MPLKQAWKWIRAEGDDIPTARKLLQRVVDVYGGPDVRSPVRGWVLADDPPDAFYGVTNCGWSRLELEAWDMGKPGTHRYIESVTRWNRAEVHDVLCWDGHPCICDA
jgi:hypothetical protein